MNRKIIWGIIVVIVIIVIVWAISGNQTVENGAQNIKIGAISNLSGNAAYYGVSTMKGIEIAKEELIKKYPDLSLEVFHEDSLFTPKGGIDAYNKLRSTQNIDAVITMASNVSVAVQPLAAKDGITHIAASSLANNFSTLNDLSFRLTAKGDIEIPPALKFMQEKNLKKLAIIYMKNEIGVSLQESLKKGVAEFGVSIVLEEGYAPDVTDFRTILSKVKQSNPDVIYLAALASHTAQILKQANEMEIKATFMSYRAGEDPVLIANAGKLAEQIIYTNAFDANASAMSTAFANAYKAKYNEEVNGYAAEGYESLKLVVESFVECGKDYVCAQKYLSSIKNRPSVLGEITFDEYGDVKYNFFLKTVKDGKFVRLEK